LKALSVIAVIASISFWAGAGTLHAEPSGYAGRTSTSSAGCGSCHGSLANSATTVQLQAGTSTTVAPGSTTSFTIVVAHASQRVAGVGIAVRTTPTGAVAAGTLAAINGQMTRLRQGEITHAAPKAMQNGQATFTFQWTAPSQEGTYYMQAIGNACNGNGGEDAGDTWAFMEPVAITVTTATSVADDTTPLHVAAGMVVAPNPVIAGTVAELMNLPGDARMLQIVAPNGVVAFQRDLAAQGTSNPLALPELPSGTYAVLIHTRTSVMRTPLTVLH
jgi:hypothetical protein